jgi:hypothetical protein
MKIQLFERYKQKEERLAYVKEYLGFEPMEVRGGWQIYICLYEKFDDNGNIRRPDGSVSIFSAPASMAQNEIFTVNCGLVVALGPDAYKDESKFGINAEPWCEVGDWISFTPQEHKRDFYLGKYFQRIDDTNYSHHLKHPSHSTKYPEII